MEKSVDEEVLEVLRRQQQKGLTTYGKPLDATESRDFFMDLAEECLDSAFYAITASRRMQLLESELAAVKAERDELRELLRLQSLVVKEVGK